MVKAKALYTQQSKPISIKGGFVFGAETFGFIAAKAFVAEVYMSIWGLDYQYNMHPYSE